MSTKAERRAKKRATRERRQLEKKWGIRNNRPEPRYFKQLAMRLLERRIDAVAAYIANEMAKDRFGERE